MKTHACLAFFFLVSVLVSRLPASQSSVGAALRGCPRATTQGRPYNSRNDPILTGDLTFIAMSDTHYDAADRPDNTSLEILAKINRISGRQLPAAVGGTKVGHPAFLLIVGDVTGDGLAAQWDSPRLPEAQSYVRAIKHLDPTIPVYEALGNHDCPLKGSVPSKIAAKFGRTYYSFTEKGVHFVVLNPYIKGDVNNPALDDEELRWLKQDLAALPTKTPIVVAMHNRPNADGGGMDCLRPDSSKALGELLGGRNVVLILRGHVHYGSRETWNGIDSVSSGFAFWRQATPPWSLDPTWTPTFLVVRITAQRLIVVEYDWEKDRWGRVLVNRGLRGGETMPR